MIKKIIPLIAVFTILIGSISVKATAVSLDIPTDMIPEYGGLAQTLMQILSAGGEISLEDVNSVNDLLDNSDITIKSVSESVSGEVIVNYYTKGSITNDTSHRLNRWQQEQMLAGNDTVDPTSSCYVGWGPFEFSTFAAYSEFWVNKFQSEVDEPDPDPLPNEYRSYIASINGHNAGQFSFYNFTSSNCTYWYGATASSRSFILSSLQTSGGFFANSANTETRPLYAINKLSVNIVGEGNSYSVLYRNSITPTVINGYNNSYYRVGIYVNDSLLGNRVAGNSTSTQIDSQFYNISGTLSHCLDILSRNFRNIDVYVNGVLWDLNYQPIVDFPDVNFSDAIGVGNYEDLAYDVVMPNTDTHEAWFDVTALLSRVNDIINDQTHDRVLTYEDVSDLVVDDAGEAVGELTMPIADVLDEPYIISRTRDYPDIPFNNDAIKDAFHGTSILAELIDGCANILPSELIVVFWGIVFILFIIGLIRIMHK